MVVCYRRFGKAYRSYLQGSSSPNPLKMGPIGCPETSATHYCSELRKIPEEPRRRRKPEMTNVSTDVLEFAWKDRQNLHKSLVRTVNYFAKM